MPIKKGKHALARLMQVPDILWQYADKCTSPATERYCITELYAGKPYNEREALFRAWNTKLNLWWEGLETPNGQEVQELRGLLKMPDPGPTEPDDSLMVAVKHDRQLRDENAGKWALKGELSPFGRSLRKWMDHNQFSVRDVAARTHVSQQTIIDIISRPTKPRPQTVEKVIHGLGFKSEQDFIAAASLLPDIEAPPYPPQRDL